MLRQVIIASGFAALLFGIHEKKLNDEQKIKAGVDKVLAFKNAIPQAYKSFTDPAINAGLQKIASAKGGDMQAYVNNALK